MQAYVINLARSADRRTHIISQLLKTHVKYEIVEAVDGRDLNLSDVQIVDPAFVTANVAHPGVVGCALSHLKVYQRILDDCLEVAYVLEDDVVLPSDLDVLTDAITPHMTGAEVVLLNFQSCQSYEPCRITKAGAVELPSSRLLVQFADEQQALSAGSYLITRQACARMVKTLLPVKSVADDWAFFHREGAIDRLRCVAPMPIIQSTALRTTMNYYRPGSLYASVREVVASSRVPILHQALALRRRRHMQRNATGRTEFVEELSAGTPGLLENR